MSNRYNYTIDENNVVSIFDSENPTETGAPNIVQPHSPIDPHTPWTKEQAEAWAKQAIEAFSLPPVPYESQADRDLKFAEEEKARLDAEKAEVL